MITLTGTRNLTITLGGVVDGFVASEDVVPSLDFSLAANSMYLALW